MGRIVVIGSLNMDLLFVTDKRPNLGETVKGIEYAEFPGGKGANQAVAAARLGAQVQMVGCVGNDGYGAFLVEHLQKQGVNTEKIKVVNDSTGLANIVLDGNGENTIIIIEGANGKVLPDDIEKIELTKGDIVLLQLEIPMETVLYSAKKAKEKAAIVILDPAPAKDLPLELYNYVDIMKPNEGEALAISKAKDIKEAARHFMDKGVRNVVITQGAQGATLFTKEMQKHFPGKKVQVVDTTAAGDSFSGALATALAGGDTMEKAINFAIEVASITVTKKGAQSSLPALSDLRR